MALGQKLGKVFGAVGSGLSFIPGPWSAVGIALSAAGGIAAAADGAMKEKTQDKQQQPLQSPQTTSVQPNNQRPEQAALTPQGPMMPGPQSSKVFAPQNSRYNLGQMGQSTNNSVMQMLIRESGGLYDG